MGSAKNNDEEKKKNFLIQQRKPKTKDEEKKAEIELVPPDGGWGWMILIGTSLTNVSIKHSYQ